MPTERSLDQGIRLAAFDHLREQCRVHGEVLPWRILKQGFSFEERRIPLLFPTRGIFKPTVLEFPLSITTSPAQGDARPYDDELGRDGQISYCYQGKNPEQHDNRGLRAAMESHVPLIYFFGIESGWYLPLFPAFITGDSRTRLRFEVAIDDEMFALAASASAEDAGSDLRRRYVTAERQVRLHQRLFSSRVVSAYLVRCAVCRLRHRELLDGAHILPDKHERGVPVVSNGIALCKIHHAAFDVNILGIRPDRVIEVREDVLREIDGPMLEHGLQGFHQQRLWVPRRVEDQPDRERLEERYRKFRSAG